MSITNLRCRFSFFQRIAAAFDLGVRASASSGLLLVAERGLLRAVRRGLWRVRGLPSDRAGLTGDVGEPGTPSSALASGFAALATRAIEIAVPPALRNAAAPRAPGVRGDCAGLPGLLGPSLGVPPEVGGLSSKEGT